VVQGIPAPDLGLGARPMIGRGHLVRHRTTLLARSMARIWCWALLAVIANRLCLGLWLKPGRFPPWLKEAVGFRVRHPPGNPDKCPILIANEEFRGP
jgi:hypothetical protein